MSSTGSHTLLRGVDRAAFATGFATQLRRRGTTIGATAVEDFVRALADAWPRTRGELYWTARVCLVRRREDLALFDAVFAAAFDDAVLVDPKARRRGPDERQGGDESAAARAGADDALGTDLPWVTRSPTTGGAEDSTAAPVVAERLPGHLAGLADTPFERLTDDEAALLGACLRDALLHWPRRRSRRTSAARRGGAIALRPTLVRARHTGWDPVQLVRAAPVRRRRRTVMLCDVSQSMQAQAAAYLYLMRALVSLGDAETFAFATSLTRLTPVLDRRSPRAAVDAATEKVADRFGGTRIATNVQALLDSHHGAAVRGAVVIIGSDGWDSDPPEQLAAAMARLRRRAHRVVWLNPRAAEPGFEPRVASMAVALVYCDLMLPAHTFAALAAAIDPIAVSSTTSRGSRAGTGRR